MAVAGAGSRGGWDAVTKWSLPDSAAHNADTAWQKLRIKRDVAKVETPAPLSEQPPNTLRLVCLSDTHNRIETGGVAFDVPAGDVLIHGGDFTNTGSRSDCEAFATWIEKQPHTHKVVIAGNHDLSFDELSYAQTRMDIAHGRLDEVCPAAEIKARLGSVCHYLEDSAVEIDGVTFYGSPWTPTFYNWAFNQDRGEEIAATWRKIPAETDVLLTHGPPVGHGDLCSSGNRAGCVDLLREIETRVRPTVHIFGHIHEGYGAWASPHCPTTFINASICTLQYNPTQGAIVFDVPKPGQPST